jgi:two-component system sensor histidine kinase CpxA
MHSLFVRIFVLFWLAMTVIVVSSIAVTYTIAAREYEAQELQRRPSAAITASEVFAQSGLGALRDWLESNKNTIPDRDFFIVGPDGKDILGRRLTESAARRLDFIARESAAGAEARPPIEVRAPGNRAPGDLRAGGDPRIDGDRPPGDPRAPVDPRAIGERPDGAPLNFRPSRQAPQIVAADGSTYTILLVPRRPSLFGALALPGIPLAVLGIALIVSALTSWWLAQHLSAPIRRIQEGARAVASEKLDVRVSAGLDGRKDELAVLARDFDAMADQLKATRSARTQLLRDISHELRSPLARMRVALGLARQPQTDPSRQLDRLEREIERLDSLISHVLKLARLHGTDTQFQREPLEIDEILQEVVQDANFEGAVKHCVVNLHGGARRPVRGNRELLHSAIENVLRNAVRYSPAGTAVDVVVGATTDELEILVRDHGPGVPGGDLERIFEPFYRVAESRDRDSGGEGIGLAITSQVFKSHGGSAGAQNVAGGGLQVRLALPLSGVPEAELAETA